MPDYTELLRKILDALQHPEIVNAISKAAQKSAWDIAAVLINAATMIGLVVNLSLTRKLLRAAQAQTSASEGVLTEAQAQNDAAITPILTIDTERYIDGGVYHPLVIRNLGSGSAFNVVVAAQPQPLDFDHAFVIPAGKHVALTFRIAGQATPQCTTRENVAQFMNRGRLEAPLYFTLYCEDVRGRQYQSEVTLNSIPGNAEACYIMFKRSYRASNIVQIS